MTSPLGSLASPLLFAALVLAPQPAWADNVVDAEMLIASPSGRYYVILQEDGEAEIVRRADNATPIRSRRGDARPTMETLRLGGTAEDVARAAGLTHGIEPEPGDAILGVTRLRDTLDRMHVFDDGSGFVARYSSSPTRFDDLEPIRGPDGADEGLVAVEQRAIGEDRTLASFVHLYTRKDSVFWGDPRRELVVMVAGGSALTANAERGAYLADRSSGERPRMVAWSYATRKNVPAPMETLLERMRSPDPNEGLVAFLLAREVDLVATTSVIATWIGDPSVPHPTRLHAAAALHAEGSGLGDGLILATALGRAGPREGEAPLKLPAAVAGSALRAYAVGILPITHSDSAPEVLLALSGDDAVKAAAASALRDGPWPDNGARDRALIDAARNTSLSDAQRGLAGSVLAASAKKNQALIPLFTALAGEPSAAVHGPVLAAFPSLADDQVVPAWIAALEAPASTEPERRAAAWSLASRAWRSPDAAAGLLRIAATPGSGGGRAEALATLWRVADERVSSILVQRAAGSDREGHAALHALLIAARQADEPAPWLAALSRVPMPKGRRGLAVRRTRAVLDPQSVSWD